MIHRFLFAAIALVITSGTSSIAGQQATKPLQWEQQSTTGYGSVEEALTALRAKSGVTFETQNGWLIAIDEADRTIWSFAPESDPSYPSVVKRQAVPAGRGSSLEMSVLCEAEKPACDALVRTFAKMSGLRLD